MAAPARVNALTITIGNGAIRNRASSTAKPSMPGICRSSVITSGFRAAAFAIASAPSRALSATVRPGADSIRSLNNARITAESSTTITRIGLGDMFRVGMGIEHSTCYDVIAPRRRQRS